MTELHNLLLECQSDLDRSNKIFNKFKNQPSQKLPNRYAYLDRLSNARHESGGRLTRSRMRSRVNLHSSVHQESQKSGNAHPVDQKLWQSEEKTNHNPYDNLFRKSAPLTSTTSIPRGRKLKISQMSNDLPMIYGKMGSSESHSPELRKTYQPINDNTSSSEVYKFLVGESEIEIEDFREDSSCHIRTIENIGKSQKDQYSESNESNGNGNRSKDDFSKKITSKNQKFLKKNIQRKSKISNSNSLDENFKVPSSSSPKYPKDDKSRSRSSNKLRNLKQYELNPSYLKGVVDHKINYSNSASNNTNYSEERYTYSSTTPQDEVELPRNSTMSLQELEDQFEKIKVNVLRNVNSEFKRSKYYPTDEDYLYQIKE